MSDLSLRLPYLIYLSIGSILVGVLVAPFVRDLPAVEQPMPPMAAMEEHAHQTLDIPADGAPEIALTVERDALAGWNISLSVENFTFTPGAVNGENVANSGHAHLYVNGQKVARLYGPHFHLPDLPPGQHEISVALNSNDHAFYAVEGVQIEDRALILQAGTSPTIPPQ